MVKISCIGTGSSGNGYIVECGAESLIIECGMHFKDAEKALGYDLSHVAGALVSHSHQDHAKYAKKYAFAGINIYATKGTIEEINASDDSRFIPVEYKKGFIVGSFCVVPFQTEHDALEPCGFLIECADGNRILFATDTYYIRYTFKDINIFMIECNYEEKKLHENVLSGLVHPAVGNRVEQSHMSILQCEKFLLANDLSKTQGIILIHLSENNSNAGSFKERISKATGKPVYIAERGSSNLFF